MGGYGDTRRICEGYGDTILVFIDRTGKNMHGAYGKGGSGRISTSYKTQRGNPSKL